MINIRQFNDLAPPMSGFVTSMQDAGMRAAQVNSGTLSGQTLGMGAAPAEAAPV